MTDFNDAQNHYNAPKSSVESGFEDAMIHCKGCSKEIHMLASACPHCGLSQRSRPYKNKNVAGLLAMLFGAFGVHRFFMGQWWGLFYLLTFWTGIPSIISFFEAIVFWCGDQVNWDRKYNEGKPASPTEQTGTGTVVLIGIVVLMVGVAFIGIIAAISIPAYQDYTIRAKVYESMIEVRGHKTGIQQYYEANNELPSSNSDIGISSDILPTGNRAELTDSGFEIIYVSSTNDYIAGKTIEFKAYLDEGLFAWDCTGGTMDNAHRPSECRDSNGADEY